MAGPTLRERLLFFQQTVTMNCKGDLQYYDNTGSEVHVRLEISQQGTSVLRESRGQINNVGWVAAFLGWREVGR
jgi:hypothetical protein